MNDSSTIDVSGDRKERARALVVPVAIAAVALALAFTALGTWGDGSAGADAEVGEFLIICGFIAVATGVVFGFVVPRALGKESMGIIALTLSILGALLAVPGFWTGVPPALAAGGALLGWSGRGAAKGHGMSQAAFVIGLLALVAYVAIYVSDWMSTNNIL